MKRLSALMFLEQFIYGGIVEHHGHIEMARWYAWMDKLTYREK